MVKLKGLRLPEEMRSELAKPHGKLYRGQGDVLLLDVEEVKSCSLLCCVGDLVSASAVRVGLKPDIAVIDGKTLREDEVDFKFDFFEKRIEAYNPAGYITCELISALKKAVDEAEQGKKVLVFVNGEEDLAVMPLGMLLPEKSLIIYGQPHEGVVALMIDSEKKVLILNLLRRMERVGECEELKYLTGGDLFGSLRGK
ncbi:GTP-dependent dephospho-CoA kinase family protein [Archaeoglobus sp.]